MATNTRVVYLDWLRIIAVAAVLFLHAAQPYIDNPWHVKNVDKSDLLGELCSFLHRFRMPLLFFISGTVSYLMLQTKSPRSFVSIRARRLGIPLLLGVFVIVPPQVYIERLTQGYNGNFLEFYPSVFTTGSYPAGNFSWHHLWFIAYLLVYDILCAPLFSWLTREKGKAFLQRLAWITKGTRLYLIILPSIFLYAFGAELVPETNDLFHDYVFFFYWLLFLLAGFLAVAIPGLMDAIERIRRTSLTSAFLAFVAITYLRWTDQTPWDEAALWSGEIAKKSYLLVGGLVAWCLVFAIVGYGKKYLNRPHPAMSYINQFVYPFYILHQTVLVIISWAVVKTTDTISLKYTFSIIVTFMASLFIYHCLIRPYRFARILFGGNGAPAKQAEARAERQPALNVSAQLVNE